MANSSNLVKILIDNAEIKDKQGNLANLDSDLAKLVRAVRSASNIPDFLQVRDKQINTRTGDAYQEIIIDKRDVENVTAALEYALGRKDAADGENKEDKGVYRYRVLGIPAITGNKTFIGAKAQAAAKASILSRGGSITMNPTLKNPDRFSYVLPFEDIEDKQATSAYVRETFAFATKLTGFEKKRRKKKAEEKALQIQQQAEAKEAKARQMEVEKQSRLERKEEADTLRRQAAEEKVRAQEIKKQEIAEKVKAKAEDQKKKKDEKEAKDRKIKTIRIITSVVQILTNIADIARRILTASLKLATENVVRGREATAYSLTMTERRGMDLFDIAKGLPSGTSVGAVSAIQGMFGDITNLDTKALSALARVMGGDIESLVTSGIGGDAPDKLLEKILDKYFAAFKSGRNSLGMQVGQEAAARELTTQLQNISPEIAALFSSMVTEALSGRFLGSNSSEWGAAVTGNRMGLSEAEIALSADVGTTFNELKEIWEDLKNGLLTKIANSLGEILNFIKNLRIGMSTAQKVELDMENTQLNRQKLEQLNTWEKERQEKWDRRKEELINSGFTEKTAESAMAWDTEYGTIKGELDAIKKEKKKTQDELDKTEDVDYNPFTINTLKAIGQKNHPLLNLGKTDVAEFFLTNAADAREVARAAVEKQLEYNLSGEDKEDFIESLSLIKEYGFRGKGTKGKFYKAIQYTAREGDAQYKLQEALKETNTDEELYNAALDYFASAFRMSMDEYNKGKEIDLLSRRVLEAMIEEKIKELTGRLNPGSPQAMLPGNSTVDINLKLTDSKGKEVAKTMTIPQGSKALFNMEQYSLMG